MLLLIRSSSWCPVCQTRFTSRSLKCRSGFLATWVCVNSSKNSRRPNRTHTASWPTPSVISNWNTSNTTRRSKGRRCGRLDPSRSSTPNLWTWQREATKLPSIKTGVSNGLTRRILTQCSTFVLEVYAFSPSRSSWKLGWV
ncbi:hypothetical protein L1049_008244 [Liquidambar formosana]|uniref:Uncharacterized protein n=1 Tax=Liquidambar formosana TaxID=63359 RepID=A0AAP0X913_LIQFO